MTVEELELLGTIIEAKNTETQEVCARYHVEDARGRYYLLRCTDPKSPEYQQSLPVHVSVLKEIADLLYALSEWNV